MLTTLGRNQDIATWSLSIAATRVPAVPHHLDDQRVGERRDQGLGAVGQVGGRVAEPGQAAQLGARPDLRLAQPGRRAALRRALQAARRADLPALRERVPHHRGGGVAAPAVQRRPPGEPVDRLQHGLLPDGHVEPGGDLERPADLLRAGVRRADHEDRRGHVAGVDDEDMARGHRCRYRGGPAEAGRAEVRPGWHARRRRRAVSAVRTGSFESPQYRTRCADHICCLRASTTACRDAGPL